MQANNETSTTNKVSTSTDGENVTKQKFCLSEPEPPKSPFSSSPSSSIKEERRRNKEYFRPMSSKNNPRYSIEKTDIQALIKQIVHMETLLDSASNKEHQRQEFLQKLQETLQNFLLKLQEELEKRPYEKSEEEKAMMILSKENDNLWEQSREESSFLRESIRMITRILIITLISVTLLVSILIWWIMKMLFNDRFPVKDKGNKIIE